MKYIETFEGLSNNLIYNWVRLPDNSRARYISNEYREKGSITNIDSINFRYQTSPFSKFDTPENIQRLNDLLQKGIRFGDNGDIGQEVDPKYKYCVSTSRSSQFRWGNNVIRVTMNRGDVSNMFTIKPIGYDYKFSNGVRKEREERIYSKKDGYVPSKLFIKIECIGEIYDIIKKLNNPFNINIVKNDDLLKLKVNIDTYYVNP